MLNLYYQDLMGKVKKYENQWLCATLVIRLMR